MKKELFTISAIATLVALVTVICGCAGVGDPPAMAQGTTPGVVEFNSGDVVLELVGAVINPSAASSEQYGYLSSIEGVDPVFNPGAQNETTALYTFFTDATTSRVISQGSLKIVSREGTTTLYTNNSSPLDFTNPASFKSGTPIQVSTLKQQVILDTVDGHFSVVNVNTITSNAMFTPGSGQGLLGRVGQKFRTTIYGRVNPTAPPGFYIGGFAVGIAPTP